MSDQQLSDRTARVYSLLLSYADKEGRCFPSYRTLAERLGVTWQAVQQHVKKLEASKYVKSEPRYSRQRQQSNVYHLLPKNAWHHGNDKADKRYPQAQVSELVPAQANELAGGQDTALAEHTSSGACPESPNQQKQNNKWRDGAAPAEGSAARDHGIKTLGELAAGLRDGSLQRTTAKGVPRNPSGSGKA